MMMRLVGLLSLWTLCLTSCCSAFVFINAPKASFTTKLFQSYIPPPGKRPKPQGGDMAYIQENVQRQMNTFDAIRQVGNPDSILDVYVRVPFRNEYWFVGKLATCVDVNVAIARQLNLIEEHATRLRPVELGRSFGSLQIWTAPGNSELLVADGTQELTRRKRHVDGCEDVDLKLVGFDAQVVTNKGVGFFVVRNYDEAKGAP